MTNVFVVCVVCPTTILFLFGIQVCGMSTLIEFIRMERFGIIECHAVRVIPGIVHDRCTISCSTGAGVYLRLAHNLKYTA